MDKSTKVTAVAIVTKATDDADTENGSFEATLSHPDMDLDGEEVKPGEWDKLPKSIPINIDHNMTVNGLVGSAEPELQKDGSLKVRGTFASTPLAQTVRTLINEGHLKSMSVEFYRFSQYDEETGEVKSVKRQLIGGAFTNYPANPKAEILSSKTAPEEVSIQITVEGETYDMKYTHAVDNNEPIVIRSITKATTEPEADSAAAADAAPADDAAEDVVKSLELQAKAIQLMAEGL